MNIAAKIKAKPSLKLPLKRTAIYKVLKFLFGFASSLLLIGFVIFVTYISTAKPPQTLPKVDGIVVLTGADGRRLLVAAQLLEQGNGERLLISGVNRDVNPAKIQALLGLKNEQFKCCVDLDYEAKNTVDNAYETANWARALGYEKILLVTSSYHIPRAKMEIAATMEAIEIIAYPVPSEHAADTPWWGGWDKTKLLVREYGKLLVSLAREPGRRAATQTPTKTSQTPVANDAKNH